MFIRLHDCIGVFVKQTDVDNHTGSFSDLCYLLVSQVCDRHQSDFVPIVICITSATVISAGGYVFVLAPDA